MPLACFTPVTTVNTPDTQNNKADSKRLYHTGNGWQLIFSLSEDELECRMHLETKPESTPPSSSEITSLLTADGISFGISEQNLVQLLETIKPGASVTGIVAQGQPAIRGEDGILAYSTALPDKSSEAHQSEDAEEQQVDFRNIQQFINVEPDQEIGRLLPPTQGTPGKTVRGKPLPAEPGNPLVIKLGQHVHAGGTSGELLFAEIHGRVTYENETLQVVEEYLIDGDIDFSIGNIRFNGYVEVRGDVLDGFQVSASKGIKITGNVGACRLISHGDIEFCGMDGQGKGSILCGGTLTAQFIHDSTIECWGEMHIGVELRTCMTHCRSRLTAGIIAGGDYITLNGLECTHLGAPSAIKTTLHCGIDYHDLDRMNTLLEKLEEIQDKLLRAKELIAINQLSKEKQHIMAAIVEVRSRRPAGSNPKVNIKDKVHEGTTIFLGNTVEEFTAEESGPVSLIENTTAGGFRRLPLTPLDILATDLEASCTQREEQERLQEALQNSTHSEEDTPPE